MVIDIKFLFMEKLDFMMWIIDFLIFEFLEGMIFVIEGFRVNDFFIILLMVIKVYLRLLCFILIGWRSLIEGEFELLMLYIIFGLLFLLLIYFLFSKLISFW